MKPVLIMTICIYLSSCNDIGIINAPKMEPQIPDSNIFREELDKNLDPLSFNRDSLMINGFLIFKHGMFNLVTDLNLDTVVEGNDTYYRNSGFEIQSDNKRILYFRIDSNDFRLSSPDFVTGMPESILRRRYSRLHERLSQDHLDNTETRSFEMFDVNDNRLRIFLLDGKIFNIIYLASEENY